MRSTMDESAYTTSRWGAFDDLEVVPEAWQEKVSKVASERDNKLRIAAAAERNKEMWRRKRKRRPSSRADFAA